MSGIGEPYICEHCGGSFVKTRSDEEAIAEARAIRPGDHIERPEDRATICDACYREFEAWARVNAPELFARSTT